MTTPPTTLTTAPVILTRAAEILTAQGWTRDAGYDYAPGREPEESPLDLAAAIAKAAGIGILTTTATDPTGVHADAVMLLARRVFGAEIAARQLPPPRWLDKLSDWQDEPGRIAEQVIAALRSAAAPASRTSDIAPAITDYVRAVRAELAAAGFDLDPCWRQIHGERPGAQILTVHRTATGHRAVIEWDSEQGWSAGWHENTYGGGIVTWRAWFGLDRTPAPSVVADAAYLWRARPAKLADLQPAVSDGRPLAELLAEVAQAPAADRAEDAR